MESWVGNREPDAVLAPVCRDRASHASVKVLKHSLAGIFQQESFCSPSFCSVFRQILGA